MLYTIENDDIRVSAATYGGEMHTLTSKHTGTEFLWNGDKAYWKYHAPFLFPIVGRVKNNQYRVDGKTYELPAHGLARVSEFKLEEQTASALTFVLTADEKSLAAYPFRFALRVRYEIAGPSVKTTLTVRNEDDKPMPFSIGAHPAFVCPIDPQDNLTDCYLAFSQKETRPILPLAPDGFMSHEKRACLENSDVLPLHKDLFQNDALIFENLASDTVTIRSKNNDKSLTITCDDFPWFGVWAPKDGAPFLCLEPWRGHCDYSDFSGEFKDKAGVMELPPGQSSVCAYTVTVNG